MGTTGADMNANGNMQSTGNYSAYGTAVPYLPNNVQMRFGQDFPATANSQFKWNQYGDWFHTYQMNNGRLIQYFYDNRGSGYSIALPKLHSYVPENIVTSALNKFGSSLYSISAVKTQDGREVYQVGLLQRGQLNTHFLDEAGTSVANYWRVEEMEGDSMNAMQSNAAMDGTGNQQNLNNGQQNMNQHNQNMNQNQNLNNSSNMQNQQGTNQSTMGTDSTGRGATDTTGTGGTIGATGTGTTDTNGTVDTTTSTDTTGTTGSDMNNTQTSDMGNNQSQTTESKVKIENADGSETKIKTENGKTKVKTKPATTNNNQ
jgi:hypothetical protein